MLNYIRLLFFVSFLILSFHSSAQEVSVAWKKEFSGASFTKCYAESSIQVKDGVVFVLVNEEMDVFRSVIKLSNKGEIEWNYRIEECNDSEFSSPRPYEIKIKNDKVYVLGQEKIKNEFFRICPNDPAHCFILCLDSTGKKVFHNRYEGTYESFVVRNSDILLMKHSANFDFLDIKVISHQGDFLRNKKIQIYNQNFISAEITDMDELIVVLSNRVVKFNKDFISKIEIEYDIDFNPEFGTKIHILPTGEILLAFTTYKLYDKSTFYAKYKLHLLNFNFSTKNYWLKIIGDSLNKDYFLELYVEKDHFFVTYLSANPASEFHSLDTTHLLKYTYTGDLVWRKSFDYCTFGTNIEALQTDEKIKIFSVQPAIDYRKSSNEIIFFYTLNTYGQIESKLNIGVGRESFKHIHNIFRIDENEYLFLLHEPYTLSAIQIKIK